ncbi:MAG: prepilin-type N-terminal cleavage/methylation domain-containing protein [Candidatus Hydrogenedentes bacterium]|nr:prepilin-type N-terminal cleavage/methylation domain-containing protein [Candidatus Hydrogenedentota bacterium]
MTDRRSGSRGFTLVEVVVVLVILSVITTTAAVALGKMMSLSRKTRVSTVTVQTARSVLLDLSAELRSSRILKCEDGSSKPVSSDTLVYLYNGGPGEPYKPARKCTLRIMPPDENGSGGGLVKEVRSELADENESTIPEPLIPEAVGFDVKCLTANGWTSNPHGDVYAVSLTVRVAAGDGGRRERVYTTSVNVPRTIWQGNGPVGEVQNNV